MFTDKVGEGGFSSAGQNCMGWGVNRKTKSEFRTVSHTIDKITQDLKVFPASKIMFEVWRKLLLSKCKKKTAKLN